MNKTLRIILVSFASLLVVLLLAVLTLTWLIFTPERLTPVVKDQLSKNLSCEFSLDNVELTFFSTFPSFGIQLNNFLLLNPLPGTPSDTLFFADKLIASVDFNALRKRNELIVNDVYAGNSIITLFADKTGKVNYDILKASDEPDTTAFKLPFDLLKIDRISLKKSRLIYADQQMNLMAVMDGLSGDVSLKMRDVHLEGETELKADAFTFEWDSMTYVQKTVLQVVSPFTLDISGPRFSMKEANIELGGNEFLCNIAVDNRTKTNDILTDISFSAKQQNLGSVVDLLRLPWGDYLEGMTLDGVLSLDGSLRGIISDKQLPHFKLNLFCTNTSFSYTSLPYPLNNISANAIIDMNLNREEAWFVRVNDFDAEMKGSRFAGSGLIDQLTGDMRFDLKTNVKLNLAELKPFMPDDLPVKMQGLADGPVKLRFLYSDYEKDAYNRMNIETDLDISNLVADYDTINLRSKKAQLQLKWPLAKNTFMQLNTIAGLLDVQMGKQTTASIRNMNLQLKTSDFFKDIKNLNVGAKFSADWLQAEMDSLYAETGNINFSTNVNYDSQKESLWTALLAHGEVNLKQGLIRTNLIPDQIFIPEIAFIFTPDMFDIHRSSMKLAGSDFSLSGRLSNLQSYLRKEGLLMGDFDVRSNTTDVNHLMALTSGLGYGSEAEVNPESQPTASSGPFMVPKGVDLTLRTTVDRAFVAHDTLRDVRGSLMVKDGSLVLESMLFTASAARMQLTGIYQTPRRNHLFAGLDFHLMDIEIAELLAMIPDVDSIMPMLRSFAGKGEFHIAVETYLDSLYNLKWSTLRGISSVKGENLVLMDGETFSEIAKKLMFNKKTKNKVDSLAAEFSIFRNEVDIYPFLIVMDKYKAVVSGRHLLDMNFDYHISLVESPLPVQLGLDVKGNPENMKYNLVPCRYPNLYRPARRSELEKKQLDIRQKIREALTGNVKDK